MTPAPGRRAAPLLVDRTPIPPDLLAHDGQPVWPVRSPEESEALDAVADLFDRAIVEVDGQEIGDLAPHRRAGVVVGLGEASFAAARLYAHLTGRRFRPALSVDAAFAEPAPSVLVLRGDALDAHVLQRVSFDARSSVVTGVVAARTEAELRRQVLVRAAAATAAPRAAAATRVDIWPLRSFSTAEAGTRSFVGADATVDDVRRGLNAGAGIVHVFTHSDGIDAEMGPGIACALVGRSAGLDRHRAPRCVLTGICHRMDLPVTVAMNTGLLISPGEVSARILIWATCLGVLPSDWTVAPHWTIGTQLFDNPRVGAAITTWSISPLEERVSRQLADMLERGLSTGEAIVEVYGSARGPETRRLLIGDPLVTAATATREARPSRSEAPAVVRRTSDAHVVARSGGWVADLIAAADADHSETARAFVDQWSPSVRHTEFDKHTRAALESVADLIAARGWAWWLNFWTDQARIENVDARCAECAEETISYTGLLPSGARRTCSICARCRSVDDIRDGAGATMRIDDGFVVRLGWAPKGEWAARLRVSSAAERDAVFSDWPRDAGQPYRSVRLDEASSPGPLRVSVILVTATGVTALTRMIWNPGSPANLPGHRT